MNAVVIPCGTCLRAEFADEDYEDDPRLFLRPDYDSHHAIGHIERPAGSWGTGSPLGIAIRSGRGRQTYCGKPMTDGWKQVAR